MRRPAKRTKPPRSPRTASDASVASNARRSRVGVRCVPACRACAGRQLLQKMGELIPNLKSRADGKVHGPGTPGLPLPGYPETLLPVANAAPADPVAMGGGPGASGGGSSKKKGKAK